MWKLVLALCAFPAICLAGEAVVLDASAVRDGAQWHFTVTILHADTGWEHSADGWTVEAEDGTRLGYRELRHPHVNEQPFTRSLRDVTVPEGTRSVWIRAHDSLHGWTSERFEVPLR